MKLTSVLVRGPKTEGDSVCYYDRWDDLIILAKNAIAAGALSKKNWENIEKRFWYKAELACQAE